MWPGRGRVWSVLAAVAMVTGPVSSAWAVYDSGFDPGKSLGDYVAEAGVNDVIQLPESGVLHYESFWVPDGVTVTFAKNADNTGVWILTGGNIVIDGTIDVGGSNIGNPSPGTDWLRLAGGYGGPGGSDGGLTLDHPSNSANGTYWSRGQGPGGGRDINLAASVPGTPTSALEGGDGASPLYPPTHDVSIGGTPWAEPSWVVLLGGGGAASADYHQYRGTGGGGVITLASSGTLQVSGTIQADSDDSSSSLKGVGGGGVVRLIADTISGDGVVDVETGWGGAPGVVRLEAFFFEGLLFNNVLPDQHEPIMTAPQVAVPYPEHQRPRLAIASVNGVGPSNEVGDWPPNAFVTTQLPIAVVVEAEYMPVGVEGLTVRMNPGGGDEIVHDDVVLEGTLESSSATVVFTLPQGTRVGTFEAWWVQPIPMPPTD